jgi:hypothetical protein
MFESYVIKQREKINPPFHLVFIEHHCMLQNIEMCEAHAIFHRHDSIISPLML